MPRLGVPSEVNQVSSEINIISRDLPYHNLHEDLHLHLQQHDRGNHQREPREDVLFYPHPVMPTER